MIIDSSEYKGYRYDVRFCKPSDGWSARLKNTFYADAPSHGFCTLNVDTVEEAHKEMRQRIDRFINEQPNKRKDWVSLVEDECWVWDGYEDGHIDEKKMMTVFEKYYLWRIANDAKD